MERSAAIIEGDARYRDRITPGSVFESVLTLVDADDAEESYDIQWRLSRAMFFLAETAENRSAGQIFLVQGIDSGRAAIALGPRQVEGHFWFGVCAALYAEAAGGLRGARSLLKARAELTEAVRIREEYHDAGPLRVLGRLEHKAPWFLKGSRDRSRHYFDRALKIAPANSVTLVYAAELFLDLNEVDKTQELLEKVLNLGIDPQWEFENLRDREIAGNVIERIKRLRGSS